MTTHGEEGVGVGVVRPVREPLGGWPLISLSSCLSSFLRSPETDRSD